MKREPLYFVSRSFALQVSDREKHFAFHSRVCEMPSVSLQFR